METATAEATTEETWMSPIYDYIAKGILPDGKEEANKIKYKAGRFLVYEGTLYKRGLNKPLLRCILGKQCEYIMVEIHVEICGNHSGGAFLAHKILHQGYYCLILKKDCYLYTRSCDHCQRYANFNSKPTVPLKPLTSPWPFDVWGIDLNMELPKGKGRVKYTVVAVDYFTKWVEAESLATITAVKLKEFVFRAILCRYGVPYKPISDNG
ncbi:uncharacterized protein LOC141690589 [Apium graveolens]|uniref:uncharacterized protein LOC141690589 n=1 Tax=Apium graveolens TaxID=4045 RepID=UPI003D799B0F